MKLRLLLIGLLAISWLQPLTSAHAAATTLSVSPGSVNIEVGKTFTVNINLNAGEAINAASGSVSYTSTVIEATGVSISGSIFSFWTDTPTVSSTKFGGGLPNPGHVGTGKIFSMTFKAKKEGTATISISGGKALANDGSGTNVYAGQSGSTVKVTEPVVALAISSSTHPSQSKWYTAKDLSLSWNKPTDVTSFDYNLLNPAGSSFKSGSQNTTSVSFSDLTDGVWTFKLTGKSAKGDRTASFKAQIDTTPPAAFTVTVTQTSPTDPFPVLSFAATDALSGIDHYEIIVEGQDAKQTTEPTLKLDRQNPGKHRVTVKAFDKAGNVTESKAEFTIEGFQGPVITEYPRFVSVLQPVNLKGKALFGARVRIFVDGKPTEEFIVKENLSERQRRTSDATKLGDDDTVEWTYFYKGTMLPGSHSFYAIQIKPDTSESNPSNTVNVRVLWSSVSLGGVIIPLALVVLILVGLLIILLLLLVWIWRHSNKAMGNWKDRLTHLKKEVDEELRDMKDDVHQDADTLEDKPQALKSQISNEIEGTIKRIDTDLDQVINIAEHEEKK